MEKYIFSGILSLTFAILIARIIFIIKKDTKKRLDKYIFLKISINKNNEVGPLATESFLANFHSLINKISFLERVFGDSRAKISLEIVNTQQCLFLCIYCRKKDRQIIENQLYAQYLDIKIEEIKDYAGELNLNSINNTFGAELTLSDPYIYPIKRYLQFEDRINQTRIDPMLGILSSISELDNCDDIAIVQVILSPIGIRWRHRAQELMKSLSSGLFSHSNLLKKKYSTLFLDLKPIAGFMNYLIAKSLEMFLGWHGRGVGAGSEEEETAEDRVDKNKEDPLIAASSKIARLGMNTNIRIAYYSNTSVIGKSKIKEITSSFYQYNQPHLNSFCVKLLNEGNKYFLKRLKNRILINPFILNIEEIASIWHIPEKGVDIPNLATIKSKTIKGPTNLPLLGKSDMVVIGKTNFRNDVKIFGIKEEDRRRHVYIIGKTGMGKSTLLENMIFEDIQNGKGIAVVDPHGDLAEKILKFVPKNRINDVVLFDPTDEEYPIAFNILECNNKNHCGKVASGVLGVFKKIYSESWGPRLEYILRNTLLALIESGDNTILGVPRMFNDKDYRNKVLRKVNNPTVLSFWRNEFEKWEDKQLNEAIAPIQNKVGQFLSYPIIRNILGQMKSTVNFRFLMDKKKIIIVNLSKGKLGEDNSSMLGSLIITKLQLDAMSRADIPENERQDFYLYIDEFQNFATDSFATILSEARKYKLNLIIANQYILQIPEETKNAVFGNVGSIILFQVGYDDAIFFANQFSEEVTTNDIVVLPKYQIYNKILIDGMPTNTFSATTLPPPKISDENDLTQKIIKVSRERYGTKKEKIEEKIMQWSKQFNFNKYENNSTSIRM